MVEKLTRRQAITALFGLTGAGLIAASKIDLRLKPFIETLATSEKGPVNPNDLVPFIKQVGEFSISGFPSTYERSFSQVEMNKELFARTILQVAEFGNKVSSERIYSLLEKRPLSIRLTREIPPQNLYRGKIVQAAGLYRPYWYGGPEITLFENYIRSYQKGLRNSNPDSLSLQYLNDSLVYHEIRHLLQDMENPIKFICSLASSDLKEGVYQLALGKGNYNRGAQAIEVDAERVAGFVALTNLRTYTQQNPNWPFGKFFIFS